MSLDPWKKKVDIFRSRFVCREDVFSVRSTFSGPGGEEKATVMPACVNYGNQKLCLIAQNKGGCSDCDHRVYQPVTDEQVYKHISGEQEMILFMLREEGIRFGAADFDKGNVFEDARAVRDLSASYGIPCYIAKSTKKGYHVYWFFSDFVKTHEFTSYIRHLFEELGFYQRYQLNPNIGLPEVFPKQTLFSDKKIGNGIKVPMMEPRMREGRNCWVDDMEQPIALGQQWEYFSNTQLILPSDFERVLQERGVEILQAPASRNLQKARREAGKAEGAVTPPKPFGDFWNVVEGCPALQEYWAKDEGGSYAWDKLHPDGKLSYDAYMASIMIAVTTTNGSEEVRRRWPDKDTSYQLNYAVSNAYTPMTCKTMQEKGVCRVGTHPKCGDHCLKKLPPVEYENGKRVLNPDNLPEEQWPEPSPIRFATDRNLSVDDINERLGLIFKALKEKSKEKKSKKDQADATQYLPANPSERVKGLLSRAYAMGEEAFERVHGHIVTLNRWMTEREWKAHEKSFKKEKVEKTDETLKKSGVPSFKFGQDEFYMRDGYYLRVWRDAKGNRCDEILTNFYILVHEELISIRSSDSDDLTKSSTAEDRFFKGTIFIGSERIPFDVNYREWNSADGFFRWLTQIAGTAVRYKRCNYDHIRNCISGFSENQLVKRKASRQIGHHILKDRPVYIMPSVVVDKDSIRQNDEFSVEPFKDDASHGLDFKLISEDELKSLARHIVTDFFACNSSAITMTTFAHAMAASILPQVSAAVGYNKSPVLWLGGSQSGGKSFVAKAAQHFYGVFNVTQNASGSAKSKLSTGYNFRHAFMLIDDYKKHLVDPFGKEFPLLIQAAYDRSGRTALQRDGQQRTKVDRVRGLLAVTGEDVIENEASAMSRTLLVDVKFRQDREAGKAVEQRKVDYCGFTPYFIQFVFNLDLDEIKEMWEDYYRGFYEPVAEAYRSISPQRICENLTLNMLAFRLSMEMIASKGAIPPEQRDELVRIHKGNLTMIQSRVFELVSRSTGAQVFLEALKELLQNPTRCVVWNWPGYTDLYETPPSATQIGFWRESTPDVVYIYPQIAHGLVSDMVRKNNNYVQTVPHIARQLHEEGYLVDDKIKPESGSYVVSMRGPNKNSVRAWPLKLASVGLELPDKVKKAKASRENDGGQGSLAVLSLPKG